MGIHSRPFSFSPVNTRTQIHADHTLLSITMASKTPGGQAASAKFQKQQQQTHGLGADNAPARKEGGVDEVPGKAPVASDSGATNTGIDPGTNQPGEKGIKGEPVDPRPDGSGSNMK